MSRTPRPAILIAFAALSLAFAPAPRPKPDPPGNPRWRAAEVISFADFDDLEVRLDGEARKAFLVGLRPLREGRLGKVALERARKEVFAELRKSALSAKVVNRRGEAVGLSLDTFLHHRNGFGPPEKHAGRPYFNRTGWGAYNFNLYYLDRRRTTFLDNFGANQRWRDFFHEALRPGKPTGRPASKAAGHRHRHQRFFPARRASAAGRRGLESNSATERSM